MNKGESYQALAEYYDVLQQDIDYPAWADFVVDLDQQFRKGQGPGDGQDGRPLMLDLGCGTGNFALQMEQRGYDVIGIDRSDSMLQKAREKASELGSSALFLLQDISRFELYGTVDLAVCLLDTLNHLIRPADVERVFRLLANYLNPGSLFIADVGTKHHFATTLGNKIFYQDTGDLTLYWVNSFRPQSQISRSALTWFQRSGSAGSTGQESWLRFDEEVAERYYDHAFLLAAARKAGLEFVGRTTELKDRPARATDERHFYIFRRRTT